MTLLDGKLRKTIIRPAPQRVFSAFFIPSHSLSHTTMNLRLLTGFAALGCLLFASCTPYNEQQNKKATRKSAQKTATTAEQQKIQEQRDLMTQKEELAKKEALANATPENPAATATQTTPPTQNPSPPVEEKRAEYKFANKVPGKDGFVFSPYNNKVVDVRDIPSGTLVQDPTYTGAGKGYFRVP